MIIFTTVTSYPLNCKSGLINLHHALQALGRPGLQVHAYDPDTVSQANLVRQRYHPSDLGRNKAEVLIRRVNAAIGTNWQAYPCEFDHTYRRAQSRTDVLLSCVDTRAARASIVASWIESLKPASLHHSGNRLE